MKILTPNEIRDRLLAMRGVISMNVNNNTLANAVAVQRRLEARQWKSIRMEAAEQDNLRERLTWAHGRERASAIMLGEDDATNEDLASWRRLARTADGVTLGFL